MSRRGAILTVSSAVAVVLIVLGAFLPVPYVALGPGPTFNTIGKVSGVALIKIAGTKTYPTTGHLNLTTVSVTDRLDLGAAVKAWFDGHVAVVPRELIVPAGTTEKQVEKINTRDMLQSQDVAITVALRSLGIDVQPVVTVAALAKGLPAASVLEAGDVVLAVDGTAVSTPQQLVDAIGTRDPGEAVRLTIRRDGKTQQVTVDTTAAKDDPSRPVVGFSPGTSVDPPFTIDINLEDVGGPSAGMMFALGIYDKLTPTDLSGGKFVAGTGTLDTDGDVGPIGGIRQKLVGARQQGATVFLVPTDNCAEAVQDPPDGLRLVRVTDFDSALAALNALGTGSGDVPSCAA